MAREPIGFYGTFRTPGVDTSAGKRLEALAGLAGGVQDIAVGIGKRAAEERGSEEGTAAGLEAAKTGQLETKSTWGYGGASYNQAAQTAYNAGITADIKNMVGDSALEFPDDAAGFKRSVEAKFSGLTSSFDDNLKTQAQFIFDQASSGEFRKVRKAEEANILRGQQADFLAGQSAMNDIATQLARDGEEDKLAELQLGIAEFTKNAIENNLVDPVALQATAEAFNDEIATQRVLGTVERTLLDEASTTPEKIQKATDFLATLRAAPVADLSAKQQSAIESNIQAQIDTLTSEYLAEQAKLTQEEMIELSNLEVDIDRGIGTPAEQEAKTSDLVKRGVIKTADKLTAIRNKINAKAFEDNRKLIGIANVEAAIAGDDPLTSEPINQDDVNNTYDLLIDSLSENPDVRSAQNAEIVARTTYVPKQLKTNIRNSLMSGDTAEIEEAVETIDRIQEIPGVGAAAFTKQETAFASQVLDFDKYMPTEEAIRKAQEITDPGNPVQQANVRAKREQIKDNPKEFEESYADEVASRFTSWSFESAANFKKENSFALLAEDYGKLAEDLWLAGMTRFDAAKEKAFSLIEARWKRGEFGLMANAPESFYALTGTGDTSYIRTEIQNDLAAAGLDVQSENISLLSDDETSRTASSGQPTYRVMVQKDDGTLEAVAFEDQDGNLTDRFMPDKQTAQQRQNETILLEALSGVKADLARATGTSKTKYSTLTKEQKVAMAELLQSSNSPFALIGRGIDAAIRLPGKITNESIANFIDKYDLLKGPEATADVLAFIRDSVVEASDNYVASLRFAERKQAKVASEMQQIDSAIKDNVVTYATGTAPTQLVSYSPGQTDKEKREGTVPPDILLKPNPLAQKQVDELMMNKAAKKKFVDGYAAVKAKLGDVDADILFNTYFGTALTAALSQGN